MKVLSKNEVDKILRESINEALRRLGGNQAAATPAVGATTTVANDPYFDCKFLPSTKGGTNPTCTGAFYEQDDNGNEILVVRLEWIHNQHIQDVITYLNKTYPEILAAVNGNVSQRQAAALGAKAPHPIDIRVIYGKEDEFMNVLPNIVNFIAHLSGTKHGFYTRESIVGLESSIKGRISEAPSKADYDLAEQRIVNNVDELLQKIQNPENIKVMGLVGGSSVQGNSLSLQDAKAAGWKISSTRNQIQIKGQLPNATFVTNAWTWENVFNRTINDKTLFAIIKKPRNDKKKDINALNRAAGQLGYFDPSNPSMQPIDLFKAARKAGNLSSQQQAAVKFLANIFNSDSASYISEKVYDVSNTTLKPGMKDVWNEEVGYADNIQGLPNAAAQAMDAELAKQNGQAYQQMQVVSRTNDELSDIIDIMEDICKRDTGSAPISNGSLGDKIAGLAFHYAKEYICPSRNIVKPSMVSAVSNGFALIFAAVYGFHVQRYAQGLSAVYQSTKTEESYKEVVKIVFQDYVDLATEIDKRLRALSNMRVKYRKDLKANAQANAQGAQDTDQPQQAVVEEGIYDGKTRILSFDEFASIMMGQGIMEEEVEEVADEPIENLQESFFNLLDRMELING